jgi:phenylacetate-CoA ligase
MRDVAATIYSMQRRGIRYGGVFNAQLHELEAGSPVSHAQRVRAILEWAGREVPYYRQVFREHGFDSTRDDLSTAPLLEKAMLRDRTTSLRAEGYSGPTVTMQTSGTTGSPLQLSISHEAYQRSYAAVWFHYGWAGVRRGDRFATLASHPVAPPKGMQGRFWVHDWLERELLFSSQHLARATLPAFADELADWRPAMVRGYPSNVYLLALHLLETGRRDIRPRAVFTSSETLLDYQREAIEAAFGCPVYSKYGNAELVAHLLQCQAQNFHVASQLCAVEVLAPDGSPTLAGEEGEMVCTSLLDRAMPLIRYRVGDRATPATGACPCGRPGPILSDIGGRSGDMVITPDGRHVGTLNQAFKGIAHIVEAQIVQDTVESVRVNVVTLPGWGPADERRLIDNLRLRLGPRIGIELQPVREIERTRNGKLQLVVSRVPLQFAAAQTYSPIVTEPSR